MTRREVANGATSLDETLLHALVERELEVGVFELGVGGDRD